MTTQAPKTHLNLPNRIAYDSTIYTAVDTYIQKHKLESIRENLSSTKHKISRANPLVSMISILEDTDSIYGNNFGKMKQDLISLIPHLKKAVSFDTWAMKWEISSHTDIRKDLITHNISQQISLYENHRIKNRNIVEILSTEEKKSIRKAKKWTQLRLPLVPWDAVKSTQHFIQFHRIDENRTRYLTRLLVFLLLENELQ